MFILGLPPAMQDQLLFLWYAGGRNWVGSRAFVIPNDEMVGPIGVAIKGRDRYGLVEPGKEYRRICRDIRQAVSKLTDPESKRLPDAAVHRDNSFPWSSLHSPRFLRLRRQGVRSGGHSSRWFMITTGPGILAGTELFDHSMGVTAPLDLDGRPLRLQETTAYA
jgi:hypothetical protein